MNAEDAWRAISDAEEELRSQEFWAADQPGDESIPEIVITRLMEREMLTREQAGEAIQEFLGSPEGLCYMCHAIAKRIGREVPPHDPWFHPDIPDIPGI